MKRARREGGFNLPELLIALALGLALLAAFLVVLQRCRDQFATNESLARLQDSGRHALSVVVTDLEHAGFYGFTSAPNTRVLRDGAPVAQGAELSQPDGATAVAPSAGLPAGAHDCGINFGVDLSAAVQGSNNSYALGRDARDCAPAASAGGARAGTDTLTVRHASLDTAAAHAGRVQLYSRRLTAHGFVELFADGRVPGGIDTDAEVRDLEVHTYYIANNSVDRPGWPALRVKSLTEARGAAQFRDEEVLPGVEDLQVELAVESDRGIATRSVRYVAPDSPTLRAGRIVAARIWLRIRSDTTEHGYRDARRLDYADVIFTPSPAEAAQRRVLIERTVSLRNLPP